MAPQFFTDREAPVHPLSPLSLTPFYDMDIDISFLPFCSRGHRDLRMSSEFSKAAQIGRGRAATREASPRLHDDWPGALGGSGVRAHCYDKLILEEIFPGIESPTHEESTAMSDFHKHESVSEKESSLLRSSFNWPSQKDQPCCQGSQARSDSLACLGGWKPTVSVAWLIRQRESGPLGGS